MATACWFKMLNADTGHMETAPMKGAEAAIAACKGEKILGSAEDAPDSALYGPGF